MQSKDTDEHLRDLALVKEILQRQEDRVILPEAVSETVGWVRFFRRDDVLALTRANIRMVFSFNGVGLATGAIIYSQILRGYDISTILLPILALYFFMIAVFSFRQLFWEGYAVLLLGIAMMVLPIPAALGYRAAGFIASAAFVTGGVHTAIASRRYG